jgi:DNA polymerase-4
MSHGVDDRRILHCDMDAFYASVHQRDDPGLKGRPVVIGGDPSGRGVVAAASYEARRFGIHSAMPAAVAARRCPHAVFIRPDFSRYTSDSEKIFSIFREFSPTVQTLSLDEAFLDLTDHLEALGSATAVAVEIRRKVRRELGLTVSVGAAPNKLVAKIASDFDKPDGLTVIPPRKVADFLAPLPIRRLHGIGPNCESALHHMGVRTVADLRELSLDRLLARFSHWGRTLWMYARGIDNRPVRTGRTRKSLSTERTFPSDVDDIDQMDGILDEMATEVASGLERKKIAACTFTIKVRYPDFETRTRSVTLPTPTSAAPEISQCARTLVRRTEADRRSVRLLGVGASNLVPHDHQQLSLFESA